MKNAISIILEKGIQFSDLPPFLRDINTPQDLSPQSAAALIRDKITSIRRQNLPEFFVGRAGDTSRIEAALFPTIQPVSPRTALIWGLPGIGRTTLARRAARDVLDFQRSLVFQIDVGDQLADLRVKLAAHVEVGTTDDIVASVQAISEHATSNENMHAVLNYFSQMHESRELPILVDRGGLINDEAEIAGDFHDLLRAVHDSATIRCFLVSRRKPMDFLLADDVVLPLIRVNPLDDDGSGRLLRQLADFQQIHLRPSEVNSLLQSIRGYPPAFYQAVALMKEYGKELLVRNQQPIIQFRERSFLTILKDTGKLADNDRGILELLPHFDSLPLPVIGEVLNLDQVEVDRSATKLLNMSLLELDENGYFLVSDPIRDAVQKVLGRLNLPFGIIADTLAEYMNFLAEDGSIPLTLYRSRFKAHVLAGRSSRQLFHFTSDLVRLQQTFYHEQEYERSVSYGHTALEARPGETEILKFLARAYIQLENYEKAGELIEQMRGKSPLKEVKFLEGFAFRKRDLMGAAVDAYKQALSLGMGGAAVHRELGQCLFEEGRFPEARDHIIKANLADPGNKFVIDIEIKIAIKEGRLDTAREGLERLEVVDSRMRTAHRRSTIEFASGYFRAAYEASLEAIQCEDRPQFEILSQFINCAIKTSHFDEAEEKLTTLSRRFPNIRSDIQHMLRCRLSLAQGKIADAAHYCELIKKKHLVAWKFLRSEVIAALIELPGCLPETKSTLEDELKQLSLGIKGKQQVDALQFE